MRHAEYGRVKRARDGRSAPLAANVDQALASISKLGTGCALGVCQGWTSPASAARELRLNTARERRVCRPGGGGHGRRPAALHSRRISAACSSSRRSQASSRSPQNGGEQCVNERFALRIRSKPAWHAGLHQQVRESLPSLPSRAQRPRGAPETGCLHQPPVMVMDRQAHNLHPPLVPSQHGPPGHSC